MSPRAVVGLAVAAHLLVKIGLSLAVPLIGDEAYYVLWGAEPALGYYDHPPMIGWWMAPLVALVGLPATGPLSTLLLRTPALLATTLVGVGIFLVLREVIDARRAALTAALFLATPIYVLEILILPDVPLLFFSFLVGVTLTAALRRRRLLLFGLAGLCLGLALISKYLAALLAVAVALVLAVRFDDRDVRRGAAVLGCAAVVPVVVNLGWNATHCWSNLLFNLFTRHVGEAERYTLWNVVYYLAVTLATLTPPIWIALVRRRDRLRAVLGSRRGAIWVTLAGLPLAVIGLGSFVGPAGIHWVLSFYPFAFLLLGAVLTAAELRGATVFTGVMSGAVAVTIVGASMWPLSSWEGTGFFESYVMMSRTDDLVERVEEMAPGVSLAAGGYSPASLLSLARGERVPVFGVGSHYGRQDDLTHDWRRLEGADLAIVAKRPREPGEVESFFEGVDRRRLRLGGATYHVVIGREFRFERYRRRILATVADRYYALPAWLPEAGGCPFCERYRLCSDP